MPGEHLLWFRDDLRLRDNDALAALAGLDVTAVYVVETIARPLGAASRWWLHHSLTALGIPREIIAACQPRTLAFHRRYHQPLARVDDSLSAALSTAETRVHAVEGFLLGEPDEVLTNDGAPYRVFTPFSRRLAEHPGGDRAASPPPRLEPRTLRAVGTRRAGRAPRWRLSTPPVTTTAATSRLSPHLRFGEVSVNRVWRDIDHPGFRRQLMWRDFAVSLAVAG